MRTNKFMDDDVNLEELAAATKNFSGAEIEGLVKAATSYAFARQIDPKIMNKAVDPEAMRVGKVDFALALNDVKPAFGVETDEFENCMRNGIIPYGESVIKLLSNGSLFTRQVANSNRTPLVSVLIEGPSGSGKTALAARLAKDSDFPYMRLLSPDTLVGYSEAAKCARITKIFEDSYKSPLSVIVVDDIERILEYVPIGPRFSNAILQTLLVLLKRIPPKGRKLFVIATATRKEVLQEMDFMDCFSALLPAPVIKNYTEFKAALAELKLVDESELHKAASSFTSESITIKRLIMIAESARQGDKNGILERFIKHMTEYQSPV